MGIFLLLIISINVNPKQIKINEINDKILNKKVQIKGEITNVRTYDDFQILSINDHTGTIDATLNSYNKFEKNQSVTIIGTIEQYKNNLQIRAEKITFNELS